MGGQAAHGARRESRYSPPAILAALTLRAVFHLVCWRAAGLTGSIVGLLALDLPVSDHTTLIRRAATLDVPWPGSAEIGGESPCTC